MSKHMVHTLNKTKDISSSAVFIMWKTAHIAPRRPSPRSHDTGISTWTTFVSSLACYQNCNQAWNLKLTSECTPRDSVIQDGGVNPRAPPCWSVPSQAHLAGPPWHPSEMLCHPAVYSEKGSSQNGRRPTFLQNHRKCQSHQTKSSFPKNHKSWLIENSWDSSRIHHIIKEIMGKSIFWPYLPHFYMALKEKLKIT